MEPQMQEAPVQLTMFEGKQHSQPEIDLLKFYANYRDTILSSQRSKETPTAQAAAPGNTTTGSTPSFQIPKVKLGALLDIRTAANADSQSGPKRAKVREQKVLQVATHLNRASFKSEDLLLQSDWDCKEHAEDLKIPLKNFGLRTPHKQTLAFRLTVPAESDAWSFSISPKGDKFEEVLYHFNPRRGSHERYPAVLQNDGRRNPHGGQSPMWGSAEKYPISQLGFGNALFGLTFDMAVQIDEVGFHVAIDSHYVMSFAHRRPPDKPWPAGEDPRVMLDEGELSFYMHASSGCTVHEVWWGWKDPMPDLGVVDFEDRFTVVHIANLPRDESHDPVEVERLEGLLADIFRDHRLVDVRVFSGRGFGFANLVDHESALRALTDLNGRLVDGNPIKLSKGRTTFH